MEVSRPRTGFPVKAILVVVALLAVGRVQAQRIVSPQDTQAEIQRAQYQEKLQQVINNKTGYADSIVRRWEEAAKASGRWDRNYASDLLAALLKLTPDNLLVAGEATSYSAMMQVLATGRPIILALGQFNNDLVYTPVDPCRIVETRNAGGAITGGTSRNFDVDSPSTFAAQGGNAGPCGVPYAVASAVAMTITVTGPTGFGYLSAYSLNTPTFSSVLNFVAGQTIANTTIVPVAPGVGNDFTIYASASLHVVIDVVGYFAAPVATALDCITATSAATSTAAGVWTPVGVECPTGRTVTGGGWDTGNIAVTAFPGLWVTSLPNNTNTGWMAWVDNQTSGARNITVYARCCRIPGR